MPTLIAGGDSFTWGSELPDQHFDHISNTPSKLTWSSLLAKHYNLNYNCVAKPGCGNSTITRKILKEINNNKLRKDNIEELYVAVMWTFTHRSEIRLRDDISHNKKLATDPVQSARYDIDDYWINFNAWHGLKFEEKMEFFPHDMSDWSREYFLEQHNTLTDIGIVEASDKFYSVTGDWAYHNYNSLKEMMFLQMFCEKNNIKYFFCSASDELFKGQHSLVTQSGLYDSINWDNWYRLNSFKKWAENYPQCGNHPGPEAHVDWFNLILPKVQECFQK